MQNIYDNKSKIYRQLFILLSSIFVFYIVLSPSETSTENSLSLLIASVAGILSIVYTILLLSPPQKYKVLTITLGFYLVKLGIGVFVYIFFIDTAYFDSNTNSLNYIYEYEWMHLSLINISNMWNENYPLYISEKFFIENKNAVIFQFYGGLYYFGGVHSLNIAPYNAFFMFLSSMLIYILTFSIWGEAKFALAALIILSLQPIHLISSSFDRHSVGLFLVLISFLLISHTSRKTLINIFLMVFAGFIAATVRKPYFIIPIMVYIYSKVDYKSRRNYLKYVIVTGIALITIYSTYEFMFSRFLERNFFDIIVQTPKLLIKSLFGVFPWNQIFDPINGREIILQYMLQAPYNITLLYFSFKYLSTYKTTREIKSIFLYTVLFYLSGVVATENHIDYLSMSIPLLAIIVSQYPVSYVIKIYYYGILIFIFGSAMYSILGFYASGTIL
jgi:hypothetical protein